MRRLVSDPCVQVLNRAIRKKEKEKASGEPWVRTCSATRRVGIRTTLGDAKRTGRDWARVWIVSPSTATEAIATLLASTSVGSSSWTSLA